jgi:hypothetical protein
MANPCSPACFNKRLQNLTSASSLSQCFHIILRLAIRSCLSYSTDSDVVTRCRDGDGAISFAEFQRMNERFPMVLYPAFKLQDAIQNATLGSKEWVKIAEKLVERKRVQQAAFVAQFSPGGTARTRNNKVKFVGFWGKLGRLLTCYYCRNAHTPAVDSQEAEALTGEEALRSYDKKQGALTAAQRSGSCSYVPPDTSLFAW